MFTKIKKMEYGFIKMVLARVQSKSPKFYITLRYLCGFAGFAAVFVLGLVKTHFFPIPQATADTLTSICNAIGAGITGVWGASFLGTEDTNLICGPAAQNKPADTAGVDLTVKKDNNAPYDNGVGS